MTRCTLKLICKVSSLSWVIPEQDHLDNAEAQGYLGAATPALPLFQSHPHVFCLLSHLPPAPDSLLIAKLLVVFPLFVAMIKIAGTKSNDKINFKEFVDFFYKVD